MLMLLDRLLSLQNGTKTKKVKHNKPSHARISYDYTSQEKNKVDPCLFFCVKKNSVFQ